jgi:hypothetical protein
MSPISHDSSRTARRSARVAPQTPGDGWITPKHGKGLLRPWRKGETGRVSTVASRYTETQQYARQHSLEAMRTLVERLRDPDGRIAVVAANSLLERAWGKVREQKPEEQQQMQLDLSSLDAAELALLVRLVNSDRFKAIPTDVPAVEVPVIEAKTD